MLRLLFVIILRLASFKRLSRKTMLRIIMMRVMMTMMTMMNDDDDDIF